MTYFILFVGTCKRSLIKTIAKKTSVVSLINIELVGWRIIPKMGWKPSLINAEFVDKESALINAGYKDED